MSIVERLKLYSLRLYYRLSGDAGVIFLESGWPVKVRRLELYELDAVEYDDPGQFLYPYKTSSGKIIERAYDLSQWTQQPQAPTTPEHECTPGSYEADLWHVYNTYQAALAHRIKEVEAGEKYARDVARYILKHCISERDKARLKVSTDYERVYRVAINPEVTREELESVLDATFPGFIRFQRYLNDALGRQVERVRESRSASAVGRRNAQGLADQQEPMVKSAA